MSHIEYLCAKCKSVLNRGLSLYSDKSFHPLQKIRCRRCGYTMKWYEMIERKTRVKLEGGPLVIPSLQQTLFATGGREILIADDFGGDSLIENFDVNTAAGTHDGSDVTQDSAHWLDGFLTASSGHVEVIYAMDPVTFTGAIDFVRWHLRAWFEELSGTAHIRQISGVWVVAGFGATNTVATRNMTGINSPTGIDLDVTVNPNTGQPWTAAQLNTRSFGMQLDHFTLDPAGTGTETFMRCSEFWIEIWGH